MKSPTELTELFRDRGLKVTPQRRAIFEALHGNTEHPTAEGIHTQVSEAMPTISLRTVYQVLHDLADMDELVQLDLGTGSTRFDPNLDEHHHLVCESCGTVLDVHGDLTDTHLPAADAVGFEVSSTQIVFRGMCAACRVATGVE